MMLKVAGSHHQFSPPSGPELIAPGPGITPEPGITPQTPRNTQTPTTTPPPTTRAATQPPTTRVTTQAPTTTQPPTTEQSTTQQPTTTQPPTTQPTPQCGGSLTSATGTLQTPNWPQQYPANTDCEWTIELPDAGKVARFTFASTFGIAGSSPCNGDYVEIVTNEGVPISLGRFCGSNAPPSITSSTNKVKVVFHGVTSSISLRGFKLSYESVDRQGTLNFCQV